VLYRKILSLVLRPYSGGRESGGGKKQRRQWKRKMKVTWKKEKVNKKRPLAAISKHPNLPFDHDDSNDYHDDSVNADGQKQTDAGEPSDSDSSRKLSESFQAQGDKLAEEGRYREALGKWEAALTLMPENAVLHEQKAQVLLEIGDTWSGLKAATRMSYSFLTSIEAWVTLGRAQLNFGEPDDAIESFDKALAIQPDSKEAQADRRTASQLVKKRKQLQSTGLSVDTNRYVVQDNTEKERSR
ncbi:Tetratricopeptide repeat protein 33, partial [Linum grandiflorum]